MQISSTYNEPSVFGSKQFTMLFILILNRVVEKMLPCEHPVPVQIGQIKLIQLVPSYGDPQGNFS